MGLADIAISLLAEIAGDEDVNELIIDRAVNATRNRPHPWSTRFDYICWSGLTDRSYNARLLPAKAYPPVEAMGTRRPPLAEVVKLFAADPAGQRVCPKSTCLFPAFAQYLTDGFIRTQIANDPPWDGGLKEDRARTTSNHEIDLSPLYGRTEAQTAVLRDPARKGRLKSQILSGGEYSPFLLGPDGKVKPEFCDAAGRPILDIPLGIPDSQAKPSLFAVGGDRVNAAPQIAMLNTLFLREHNRLAAALAAANPGWDSERVFQIARNIMIFMFIRIVVEEYINHINTSVFSFRADPKVAWRARWNRPNWMTAEFSLLYRWHSLVPETLVWGGQSVPGNQLLLDNRRLLSGGLANAFVEISGNNAAQLGLGNSASFLVRAEGKAVEQARHNRIASYNDYREAMDEDRAKSFEEVVGKSKDAKEKARRAALAARLKTLYGSVDNIEFYVGLFAEPPVKNGPLPELILGMVAMDAFSQALTNPLLSEHVWGDPANRRLAFTELGLAAIEQTHTLRDVLARNSTNLGDRFVGMTRRDWVRD